MEEELDGFTLGDVFGTIISQKWLALILTVIITVAATAALYFGYNPRVTEYVSTFTVSFPGGEGANPVFPDNSPFDYREIISRSNIEAARASDEEKFGYIDTGKLYEDRDISIYRTSILVSEQVDFSYTVKVGAKYFKNKSDASDFIDALALMPVNYLLNLAKAQDGYLLNYDSADFFEDKMEILSNQINYLISSAEDLVANTGNSSSSIQLLSDLNKYYVKLRTVIGNLRDNLYVHNVEEVYSNYSSQLTVIEDELAQKIRERELIYGLPGENVIIQNSEKIEQLAAEISKLEEYKEIYSSYVYGKVVDGERVDMKVNTEFSSKLVALGTELKALTDRFENSLSAYFERYTLIAYDGALVKEGELNLIVCLLIGLIAGLVVAVVVAYIVGSAKRKKNLPKAEPSAPENKSQE